MTPILKVQNKTYEIDEDNFLVDAGQWDADFAAALAPLAGIRGGLTDLHWKALDFIRKGYLEDGSCPLVHSTCRVCRLSLKGFARLFPSGYRWACRMAGVCYIPGDS